MLIALWIAGGGALVTWFAVSPGAPTAVSSSLAPVPQAPPPIGVMADDFAAQAARLRDHLASDQLRPSARNPFRFAVKPPPVPFAQWPGADRPAAAIVPRPPVWTLSGIGERKTPEGLRRTAVISVDGQLHVVVEGQVVAGGYAVASIAEDRAVLRDQSGVEMVLRLR